MTDGKPTFQLDPSCKVLRKGFNGGYHYKKIQGTEEKYTKEPTKNRWSHPHDALQYAAMYVTESIRQEARAAIRTKHKRYQPASYAGY
jgi:hypothetical protein